jgi:hypothetical protein
MKRVVLVAPEFPPSNTAGAHRPRLLAKHLPAYGWTPTVLTIRRDQIEGPLDPLLEQLLDPGLEVVRTAALPIRPVRIIGDVGLRSLGPQAWRLTALVRRGDVNAVVIFGPPWFSFLLGPLVRRCFGTPYVIDYIDPWISDWTAGHPFPGKGWWHHRAAVAIEPAVLRGAFHITAVSSGFLEELRARYPWLDPTRTTSMPYGAEPDDIDAAVSAGLTPPDFRARDGAFNVCFTGAIQPRGGELLRAALLGARELRDAGSELAQRVRLRFYGTSNLTWGQGRYAVLPIARELGIADVVSEIPERIPYLQAMAVLGAADVVLVMGSTAAQYDASKLYPAIMSGRPILAICHADSSMRQIMDETEAGCCVTFSNAEELGERAGDIRRALEVLATRPPRPPDPAVVGRFSARASAGALAQILDRTIDVKGTVAPDRHERGRQGSPPAEVSPR